MLGRVPEPGLLLLLLVVTCRVSQEGGTRGDDEKDGL